MCSSPAGSPTRQTPLWLSHHWPEHYDRCVTLGRVHVCRRCLVLYPLTLVTIVVVAVFDLPFGPLALALMWLLPAPMTAEWVLEHAERIRYSPGRQIALAAVAAPAIGIALAEHLRRPFTPAAVAPVLVYTAVCAASALWSITRRPPEAPDWEAEHDEHEAERLDRLQRLLTPIPTPEHAEQAPGAPRTPVDPGNRPGR